MDQDVRVRDRRVEERWRRPEFVAAVLNGALILVAPTVWAAHADYTWDAVRPYQPTLLSSTVNALPVLVGFAPVALLVAWRTYVHATAYRLNPITVWRGPLESAGIAGALALMVMLVATAATWVREPFQLVIAYIAFYAIATALVGLVLGLVLAATALLALHIMRLQSAGRRPDGTDAGTWARTIEAREPAVAVRGSRGGWAHNYCTRPSLASRGAGP